MVLRRLNTLDFLSVYMSEMEIVFVVVGILAGTAIGWLFAKQFKETGSEDIQAELIKTKANFLRRKETALNEELKSK